MGVVGAAFKGFGKAFLKGKKAKLKTIYRVKPRVDISAYKQPSKKASVGKKLDVWVNRESGKMLQQAGSGINIKYTKKGKPYVPKGTQPSMLTKAEGVAKLTSPITGGITAGAIHAKIKDKKK